MLGAMALTANLISTLYMLGLIWFVQVVHYPLFSRVGAEAFPRYETDHVARTGPAVGPAMLVEAASAAWLAFAPVAALPTRAAWLGLALVGIIWISTALLQVPCHTALGQGFDAATHRRLVRTNWIRTAAWTLRAALLTACLFRLANDAGA